ncbi:uncharacterized protein LOC122970175 [Thunnus albacares]|uniref:uncharacterized protein LOC122970175 n=1 Tax=Thunnus albacares TaxID=8236 RepID=UPI001CF6720F|nr:uncharacterized protein LOC122970175 [Thunnus albacares]
MANRETSKHLLQRQKNFIDHDTPESYRREHGLSDRNVLNERAERLCASQKALCDAVLKRLGLSNQQDTLTSSQSPVSPRRCPEFSLQGGNTSRPTSTNQTLNERAERLCASQKAFYDAVLERLGISKQHETLPSLQPPASPKKSPKSSLRRRNIRHGLKLPPIVDKNSSQRPCTSQEGLYHSVLEGLELNDEHEEDPFFEEKLRVGSKRAMLACKLAKTEARRPSSVTSICSADSLSSVDKHTPNELRAIPQIRSPVSSPFTPTLPPTAAPLTRRASRLPVMSANLGGTLKEVADGCKLWSHKGKVEELVQRFQLVNLPSPQPPVAARKTAARTPVVPAPPTTAAPPKRGGPRRGTNLRPQKTDKRACQDELQPLAMPSESLSLCFKQLKSDDWEEKINGLKSIQALARHHPQLLQTKLHEVCLALIKEVNNLRSSVACAAMESIAQLHIYLGKAMDPEAEVTGRTLLLKLAQTTNDFIHQHANHALDALVEGCSPGRVVTALLNTGLSHLCAAVRGSTAKHLHLLAEIVGEDHILTGGKMFTERFLSAVCKMSVDAALDVRHYGHKMLQGLVLQREFTGLWNKVIPVKDRHPLEKIIKKMVQ